MDSKRIIFALVVLLMSATGYAADVEPTKPAAADGKSSPSDVTSYFQGVWVGQWPWGENGVDLTITVGKANKEGLFATSYSWGPLRRRDGSVVNPGSIKTWGKEQGDQFLIEWKDKQGIKFSITLKRREDSVKAIYDTEGPIKIRTRADLETYIKRK